MTTIDVLAQDFSGRLLHVPVQGSGQLPSRRSAEESELRQLTRLAGDGRQLLDLDDQPLPAEALDLGPVPEDLIDRVTRLDELVQRAVADRFDQEIKTACRRALVRLSEVDPAVLRRRAICQRRDDLLSILRRRGFDVTAELLDSEPASQLHGWW